MQQRIPLEIGQQGAFVKRGDDVHPQAQYHMIFPISIDYRFMHLKLLGCLKRVRRLTKWGSLIPRFQGDRQH
jgi:hypothetical protein